MAKIDTSKIENYADMSAEEKLAALEAFEFEVPKADNTSEDRLKSALSKANAEAAEWKRQYKDKLSEQERAEADRAEAEKAMRDELESLRRERAMSRLEAQYLAAGYSAEMAAESAKAQADGDTATVLRIQSEHLAQTKKALEAAALGKQPTLSVGEPPKAGPQSEEDKIAELAFKYAGL